MALYCPLTLFYGLRFLFLRSLAKREKDIVKILEPLSKILAEYNIAIFVGKYGAWIAIYRGLPEEFKKET